jgi:catechol 2,3-dioxygenase-like lactoylglutathione lyase family enzyme
MARMEQRVHILTLRVEDLETATRYYVDGLGWRPVLAVPGEVTFLQVAPGLVLSLFDAKGFDEDAGRPLPFPFNLAQIVGSEAEVDEAVAEMVRAGGSLVQAPERATWGGYHAFAADAVGFCWEIATNPGWSVADDGTVSLGS